MGHGQLDTARIVKHFSKFPFGVKSDPLEIINIWRHVLVQGQEHCIDRFLHEIGQRFEGLGWSRDTPAERLMNRENQINRFYCWINSQDDKPRVLLCLNRATSRRVRGGTYSLLDAQAGFADLANAIRHVLSEVVEPAAGSVGLAVSYPRLGPISRIDARTGAAMAALAEASDGQWPLPDNLEPVWRSFVLTAFYDGVALNPEELTAWFVASGWDEHAAIELTKRFYAEATSLGEFEEAGSQTI
jgi:hypothetical protein